MTERRVTLLYDPLFLRHINTERGEYARPARLLAILAALGGEGASLPGVRWQRPRPATVEQVAVLHAPAHIERVRRTTEAGGGPIGRSTGVSRDSFAAALLAVGAALDGVDLTVGGAGPVFGLVRPPGHHATADEGMGFCLFNNAALAARHALDHHGLARVLLVDFDVHHGNGTQDLLWEEGRAVYFSIHQVPLYPGTGLVDEIGAGTGRGATVNVPLPPGVGDTGYALVFERVLRPIAERLRPELLIVSAGYDAHAADPLAQMEVSTEGFALLTAELVAIAGAHCPGRLLFLLEGGYDPPALGASVRRSIEVLAGGAPPSISPEQGAGDEPGAVERVIADVRRVHGL